MNSVNAGVFVLVVAACGGKASPTTSSTGPTGPTGQAAPSVSGTIAGVVTGEFLSCDLDAGVVRCWGELGDNAQSVESPTPTESSGDFRFTQLSAFGGTVCGVTAEGRGYCWGPNTDGQLGTGTADAGSKTPVAVAGDLAFTMIAAGVPTSCGITTAGAAYCWGDNGYGQVGNGVASTDDILSPAPVAGGLTFSTISVSGTFACGVTTDGAAYCWGANASGQLGNGKPISGQTTDLSKVPSKVVGGQSWKTVSTGQFFACGLTTAGAAFCWGKNDYQFGNGDSADSSTPVAVSGGHVLTQLDVGHHFACGLTRDGAALCWGSNSLGQLGNGPGEPQDLSRVPLPVATQLRFSAISASNGEHTCGVTLDRAATYCWGRNDRGQLGTGAANGSNTTRAPVPAKVAR